MKKHILLFVASSPGFAYGIKTYLNLLINALECSDFKFTVVHLFSDLPELTVIQHERYRYIHFPKTQNSFSVYCRNACYYLRSVIEEEEEPIFHLNFMHHYELGFQLKKHFTGKVILTIHYLEWALELYGDTAQMKPIKMMDPADLNPDQKRLRDYYETDKKLLDLCDHIIALSAHSTETLQGLYEIAGSKITLIHNALMDKYHHYTEQDRQALKSRYYFNEDEKIIIFAGRFQPLKGLSFLLKAFHEVLQVEKKCTLVIAGEGTFRNYLNQANPIWNKVVFTGLIPQEDLYRLYSIADLGVVPSLYEEFGFVAIEMMMHGISVVVNGTTGLKETVRDGVDGLHLHIDLANDPESGISEMKEKMLRLLKDKALRREMGEHGRQRFLQKYTLDIFRKAMIGFYSRLFTNNASPTPVSPERIPQLSASGLPQRS